MSKILISMPDKIALRMRAALPQKQRSKIIVKLIEKEIEHLSYLKTKTFNLKYRFEMLKLTNWCLLFLHYY